MKRIDSVLNTFLHLLVALLIFVFARPISAQTTKELDDELTKFAERTLAFLSDQGQTTITVGTITGTGKASIPGGPGIATKLIQALESVKAGSTSDTAQWSIEGRMIFGDAHAIPTHNSTSSELSLTISFTLINRVTQAEIKDKVVIAKLSQAAFFVGTTFQTAPQADIKEQRKEFVQSLESTPFIDPQFPSRVRTKAGSPFALELRAKPIGAENQAGQPVLARIESRPGVIGTQVQPFAFAPIGKNQEYEVVVYNDSGSEIAVSITIDGIDVFAFSDDKDPKTHKNRYSHFLIAAHDQPLVLPGWHKTVSQQRDDNFLAFLITEYGKGARSKLFPQQAPDSTVGAVTVGISQTFKPGDGAKSAQAETGLGRKIKQDQTPVERSIEPPHAFITIRYDR